MLYAELMTLQLRIMSLETRQKQIFSIFAEDTKCNLYHWDSEKNGYREDTQRPLNLLQRADCFIIEDYPKEMKELKMHLDG